jgi:aspartate racemase
LNSLKEKELHIGVLGLGSRSTIFYIEELNRKYNDLNGGYSTCPFILLNTNFNEINPFLPDNLDELKINLLPYLNQIQILNINALLIPNITLHETTDLMDIQLKFNISVIHPIANTVKLLKEKKQNKVMLFGSLYSMRSSYITGHFLENDIQVILPKEKEMRFIDDLRQKVYENKESSDELIQYQQLVKSYSANKSVVIACTELSLILDVINENVYDMARIQINRALK